MLNSKCNWRVAPLAALVGAAVPLLAAAAEPAIRDDAKFFKPETVEQAMTVLQNIKQQSGRDVVVETFAAIPDEMRSRFNSMDKGQFYEEWSASRARELNVDGVYIGIVKQPGHLDVRNTSRGGLHDDDRQRLSALMLSRFKNKEYDAALLEGVRFIQSHIAPARGMTGGANTNSSSPLPGPGDAGGAPARPVPQASPPVTRSPPPQGGTGPGIRTWLCLGAGVLIVVLLIRAARGVRRGFGAPGGGMAAPGEGGSYGGGGGFGRGIFGGLLGGLLGNWIAGRMSDHQSYGDSGSSGGGSFGDSSGSTGFGGDAGGSSGGDFGGGGGGGDFSGGGDSGGSSGGDF